MNKSIKTTFTPPIIFLISMAISSSLHSMNSVPNTPKTRNITIINRCHDINVMIDYLKVAEIDDAPSVIEIHTEHINKVNKHQFNGLIQRNDKNYSIALSIKQAQEPFGIITVLEDDILTITQTAGTFKILNKNNQLVAVFRHKYAQ